MLVTIPPEQIKSSVAAAVNQAKRCSQGFGSAEDARIGSATIFTGAFAAAAIAYPPPGVAVVGAPEGNALGVGAPVGFVLLGAPGGATDPGVGPTAGSPGGLVVAGGAL